MAELIKKVKVMKQDGTFTNYIPLGADAANVKTTSGESVQTILDRIQQKGISIYDNINSIADDIDVNEIFMLRNYDTLFTVVSSPTISSLQIGNNRYADVISKRVVIDSLGITTIIDPTLFSEIVSYAVSEGIELVFAKKTYTLNETITINASGLNLSGLSQDSRINYTGNDYAFIIQTMTNCMLSNFRIRCNGSNNGIYFKNTSGSNHIISNTLYKIKIDNAVNAIKSDCYMKNINFEDCTFEVSALNGVGIDFSNATNPDLITINKCIIENTIGSTGNESYGIILNNGKAINITNNNMSDFKYMFYMNATNNTAFTNTINISYNYFSSVLDTAIYINGTNNSYFDVGNVVIKNCVIDARQTNPMNYGIFISNVYDLTIDNFNIMQQAEHLVWLSNCSGEIRMVYYTDWNIDQTKNQINDSVKYNYKDAQKTYTVPANGSVSVSLGSVNNLINFNNYILTRIGANNSTSGLTVSNYANANGKISFTLSNSNSASVDVFIQGF